MLVSLQIGCPIHVMANVAVNLLANVQSSLDFRLWLANQRGGLQRSPKEVPPELLTDVPALIQWRMWFQKDRALSHYGRCVRDSGGFGVVVLSLGLPDLLGFFSLECHEEPCVRHARQF
ncbi:hypothetical protein TNCV_4787911 [Trichonephila clavipes]|nr:hypothetical protein TNCV_4787911 [Trichonephila clavipes]